MRLRGGREPVARCGFAGCDRRGGFRGHGFRPGDPGCGRWLRFGIRGGTADGFRRRCVVGLDRGPGVALYRHTCGSQQGAGALAVLPPQGHHQRQPGDDHIGHHAHREVATARLAALADVGHQARRRETASIEVIDHRVRVDLEHARVCPQVTTHEGRCRQRRVVTAFDRIDDALVETQAARDLAQRQSRGLARGAQSRSRAGAPRGLLAGVRGAGMLGAVG